MPEREHTSPAKRRPRQVVPAVRAEAGDIGPRARRTVDRILEATREVFMTKGYFGTTPDETPNENYTLSGVTSGKPTPENQRGK